MTNAELWLMIIASALTIIITSAVITRIVCKRKNKNHPTEKHPIRMMIYNCPPECDREAVAGQIQAILDRWLIFTDLCQKVILPVEYHNNDEYLEKEHPGMIVVIVQVNITDSSLALYVDGGIKLGIDKLNAEKKFDQQIFFYRVQQ